MENPIVFISYSWDNEDHKEWVLNLANQLRENGVDVILDRYYLRPGKNLSYFVEDSLRKCNRIITVLTPNYKAKAENRGGGVGQEYSLINNNLVSNIKENDKVIPVLKVGVRSDSIPDFFQQYIYIDFTKESEYDSNYETLIRDIYDEPEIKIPELGKKPDFKKKKKKLSDKKDNAAENDGSPFQRIKIKSQKFLNSSYTKRKEISSDIYELATSISLNDVLNLVEAKNVSYDIAAAICFKSISQNMNLDLGSNPNIRKFVSSGMTSKNSFLRYRIFDLIATSEILCQDFSIEIQRQGLKEDNDEIKRKIESILNINQKGSNKESTEEGDLKEEVRESLMKGNTKKALEILRDYFSDLDDLKEQFHLAILLSSQYNEIQKGKIQNTLTLDEFSRQQNRINYSILNMIDEI